MNKAILGIVILLILIVAGVFFVNNSNVTGSTIVPTEKEENSQNNFKTFVMTGENFKFVVEGVDNPEIKVKQGDKIRIEFTSTQGFHDVVIDEFDAATEQVRDTDGMTFVEFTADKKGTFEYYCSVGQHRANGMKGNFIVE
jgi:plastocyanin